MMRRIFNEASFKFVQNITMDDRIGADVNMPNNANNWEKKIKEK